MIKISEFYSKQSNTERKLVALQQLVDCEKLSKVDNFSIVGGGASISATKIGSVSSSITIAPELNDKLHADVIKVVEDYIIELRKLNAQITNEKEQL